MVHETGDDHDNIEDSGDEISIDFSKVKKIFSGKNLNVFILILLMLIPIALTIYIRLQPQYLPYTDDMAKSAVENYYKNNIAQQVNTQYPNLPTTQKQQLIDQQFSQFSSSNSAQLTQQIQQTSQYFKTGFQYQENNRTYTFIGDLDSYFYLRQARNKLDKGVYCDQVINGTCYDMLMMAPLGVAIDPSMQPVGIYYTYLFLHSINSAVNLMDSAIYLQVLVSIIVAIVAFLIGRRLMNDVAGFFAAIFVVVSPIYLTRTLGGGHDQWAMLIPLITVYTFIEAFEAKSTLKRYIWLILSALTVPWMIFGWTGWWYIFDIILGVLILYIAYQIVNNYIKHKSWKKIYGKELGETILMFVVFLVAAGIFVSIFYSFSTFTGFYMSPLSNLHSIKSASQASLWPNVLTTVAELNNTNISAVVDQASAGIHILFSLALLGIIFTLIKKKPDFKDYALIGVSAVIFLWLISSVALNINPIFYLILLSLPVIAGLIMTLKAKDHEHHEHSEQPIDVKISLLLLIWFLGTIFTSVRGGVRFIVLLTPVMSISLGMALGYIYQHLKRFSKDNLKLSEYLSTIIVFVLLCLVIIVPVQIGIAAGRTYMPSMTKGWWDSLTQIKTESKPDAIINSWWDFGHWFKYVAERRVTADGITQVAPTSQWLGEVLQSNSENQTLAVLRMLDCGSNRAFEDVDKKFSDTDKSHAIVSQIIMMSKDDAKNSLQNYGFTNEETDTILSYTHCSPPEDYFITSEDMVGKAGVWAHFGLWDFDKAYIINSVKPASFSEGTALLKEKFNYTDDEASKTYYDVEALQTDTDMNNWISPWPSYATGSMIGCSNISEIVICPLGMNIGSNGQQNVVLERAVVNMSNPGADGQVLVGIYDPTTNAKLGENIVNWNEILVAGDTLTTYKSQNASMNLAFLLNIDKSGNQTTYNAMVADPLLIDSTFTKLFYLNGKYMNHFEKFSDVNDITGQRIIIWKVKW